MVLANLPYSTGSAWGQSNSANDVFSKKDMENAVRVMGSMASPEAHGHILCSDLMFYHRNRSPCATKEEVNNVKTVLRAGPGTVVQQTPWGVHY